MSDEPIYRVTLPRTDPAQAAIRLYRACGFADAQSQFSFQRAPEG